jgi:hypothetical protein
MTVKRLGDVIPERHPPHGPKGVDQGISKLCELVLLLVTEAGDMNESGNSGNN